MAEKVTCYSLDNSFGGAYPIDRETFYDEEIERHIRGETPQKAVAVVNIFLINESGELIIQKRSSHKRHNPNLLDKSIGGHIQRGDPIDYTVMVETVQELQVPSIVVREDEDFRKTFEVLRNYLSTIAIVKHIDTYTGCREKRINEKKITIGNKASIFLGVYGGSIKNIDREAKGILFYSLDDLIDEMQQSPDIFTNDLHIYVRKYEKHLREFIALVTKKE